jgi:hypothetical protein
MNPVSEAENAEFGEICKFGQIESGDRAQCMFVAAAGLNHPGDDHPEAIETVTLLGSLYVICFCDEFLGVYIILWNYTQ